MNHMEKSYLEIKVTLLHIVVMLVGVIVIGIFLFYLGYQAGKSSLKESDIRAQLKDPDTHTEEIKIYDDDPATQADGKAARPSKDKTEKLNDTSIKDELKLHRQPPPSQAKDRRESPPKKKTKTGTVKSKTLKRELYYSVQVGAFSSFSNAKNYAAKFQGMGYPAEILSTIKKSGKLYRVRIGTFKTKAEARKHKEKLERMEKKKFAVTRSR